MAKKPRPDRPLVGKLREKISDVNNTGPSYYETQAQIEHDRAYGTQAQQDAVTRPQPQKWLDNSVALENQLTGDPHKGTAPNVPANWFPPVGEIAQADARDQGFINQQQGNVQNYADLIKQITGDLGTTYAGLNATDNATLDQLKSALAGIPLVTSQGAQAYADPQSIANENLALAQLQAIGGGSLDQVSQAAQAYANPEDIAHQNLALSKLLPLTDMQMTAQERFMMEQARQNQEMDMRGGMDAALRNLAARGQLGSGHEIGAVLGMQQNTSQNRILGDLGAEANAIARQMKALGMYSDLSTNMRNEGFTEAFDRGQAADSTNNQNANRRLTGTQSSGDLSSKMRDQSFDESFKRGQAADVIAVSNQAFQRGTANDVANAGFTVTGNAGNRAGNLAGISATGAGNTLTAQTGLTHDNLAAGAAHDQRTQAERDRELAIAMQGRAEQNAQAAIAEINKKRGILGLGFGPDIPSPFHF